jgi:hypothetical protein
LILPSQLLLAIIKYLKASHGAQNKRLDNVEEDNQETKAAVARMEQEQHAMKRRLHELSRGAPTQAVVPPPPTSPSKSPTETTMSPTATDSGKTVVDALPEPTGAPAPEASLANTPAGIVTHSAAPEPTDVPMAELGAPNEKPLPPAAEPAAPAGSGPSQEPAPNPPAVVAEALDAHHVEAAQAADDDDAPVEAPAAAAAAPAHGQERPARGWRCHIV